MGSWLYAYGIPEAGAALAPSSALRILRAEGFEPDERALEVLPDAEGHCEPRGKEYALSDDRWGQVGRLLDAGTDLEVTCRSTELYLACTFARRARSPHVMVGWSVNLFRAMGSERQRKHLDVVATFCEAARAASVVLVEDAPGYFEDRIAVEDESTLVDAVLPVGAVAEILEVWTTAPDLSVEGCTAWKHGNVARFHRHLVAPAPSPRS